MRVVPRVPASPAVARLGVRERGDLIERLRERLTEIELATAARVDGVSDLASDVDSEYRQGLRAAISAACEYGLEALACDDGHPPPAPLVLLAQARLAARHGVGLDSVLRRYVAGYGVFGDFLIEQAHDAGLGPSALRNLMHAQRVAFDYLLSAVAEEYAREGRRSSGGGEERRAKQVRRLLAGERLTDPELGYDLGGRHLGAIVEGRQAEAAMRELAQKFDRRLLMIRCDPDRSWAWLGSSGSVSEARTNDLIEAAPGLLSTDGLLAFGESGDGLGGWRLTHRQATTALLVTRAGGAPVVRYSKVALVASVLQDEVAATSLRRLYLEPLAGGRDDGATLRDTLDAHFAAGGQTSSAAAALGVTRRTINNRLREIERRIGSSIDACAAELRTALTLAKLDEADPRQPAPRR